jgi:hypothetical protein
MPHAVKTDADRLADANDIIRKMLGAERELKKQIKDLHVARDEADEVRQKYFEIAAYDPTPPEWISGRYGKIGARGCPITVWSDPHCGEVVKPSGVNGANKYNKYICEKRFIRLFEITVDLCYNHMGRAKTQYPGIIVGLGGDMVGGDIHEELARSNDLTPLRAVEHMTDILCGGLEHMASKFGKVYVPAVVGNHGRTLKKPPFKNLTDFNYDYSLYCNLIRHFKKTRQNKWVHIDAPHSADCHFQSYGTRYMLTHGDNLGVKGGDGIIGAIGPIMRGSIKLGAQTHKIGLDFDELVLCHWHQLLWLPGVTVNNTLKGFDEYSALRLRAPPTTPSQALWFNHPEWGTTARWEVYLEGKLKASDGVKREWASWLKTPSTTTSD